MYQDDNWNIVEGDELVGFLDQISPIEGKYRVSADSTQVHWRKLPFYQDDSAALIRVRDPNWINQKLVIYYMVHNGMPYRLNGTSPPIHDLNSKVPITITDDNVLEYLRFFCFFVRGEEGPFYIAETMDDPNMPEDQATRSVVGGTIRPATYEGKNEKGYYLCDAVVFYSNALFIANFEIQPGGMIEMLDDEPIAGELPAKIEVPIS